VEDKFGVQQIAVTVDAQDAAKMVNNDRYYHT